MSPRHYITQRGLVFYSRYLNTTRYKNRYEFINTEIWYKTQRSDAELERAAVTFYKRSALTPATAQHLTNRPVRSNNLILQLLYQGNNMCPANVIGVNFIKKFPSSNPLLQHLETQRGTALLIRPFRVASFVLLILYRQWLFIYLTGLMCTCYVC